MGAVIQPVGIDYHRTKVADSNGKVRTFPSLAGPMPDESRAYRDALRELD